MKYVFTLLFACTPLLVCAQRQGQALIDSLLKKLPAAKEDTSKVNLLDKLSFAYSTIDPDEGLRFAGQAMKLSETLKWRKGIALASADMGINYAGKPDHVRALQYDLKALELYEGLGDSYGAAAVLANISLVYLARSNYPKALEYDFKALRIYESVGDRSNRAIVLENIGTIYFEQKNYARTMEYYTYALKIHQDMGDQEGMARNSGNIGIVLDAKGDYEKALEFHKTALQVHEKIGNKQASQVNLANIGYVYCHLRRYDEALKFQLRALKFSREFGNKNDIAIDLGNIGETYFAIGKDTSGAPAHGSLTLKDRTANFRQSINYLESAVSLCRETGFSGPLIEFTQYLSDAYALSGRYKDAFQSHKEYMALKDSVFSIQNNAYITDLETKREIELKNKDLLLKDKQVRIKKLEISQKHNEFLLYIAGIVLLLLIIGIMLRSFYLYRKSNKNLLKEKKADLVLIEEQINSIKKQTRVLEEIAHMQAHEVRGPVATILGLVQLFNVDDFTDPTNKVVIEGIATITEKLDAVVREIINKENRLDIG